MPHKKRCNELVTQMSRFRKQIRTPSDVFGNEKIVYSGKVSRALFIFLWNIW